MSFLNIYWEYRNNQPSELLLACSCKEHEASIRLKGAEKVAALIGEFSFLATQKWLPNPMALPIVWSLHSICYAWICSISYCSSIGSKACISQTMTNTKAIKIQLSLKVHGRLSEKQISCHNTITHLFIFSNVNAPYSSLTNNRNVMAHGQDDNPSFIQKNGRVPPHTHAGTYIHTLLPIKIAETNLRG